MLIIRPYDMPNKQMYFNMLCEELDSMGLENHVADVSKQYLYIYHFSIKIGYEQT